VLDIGNLGEEKILGWKQAAGESLTDVYPALFIRRGEKIKTCKTKAQRKTADGAKHYSPRVLGKCCPREK
jgi:hypothetical protein